MALWDTGYGIGRGNAHGWIHLRSGRGNGLHYTRDGGGWTAQLLNISFFRLKGWEDVLVLARDEHQGESVLGIANNTSCQRRHPWRTHLHHNNIPGTPLPRNEIRLAGEETSARTGR